MSINCYCRLCAEIRPESDLLEMTSELALNLNLEYKIFRCFHIEMKSDENLPKRVCPHCCELVVTTFDLIEKVKRVQEQLLVLCYQGDLKPDELEKLEEEFEEKYDDFEGSSSDLDDVPLSKRTFTETESCSTRTRSHVMKVELKTTISEAEEKNSKQNIALWKNYKWSCTKCSVVVETVRDLRNHYENIHNSPPEYKCMECPKIQHKYALFQKHVGSHRNKHRYKCEICGKYSHKRAHHERHLEVHSKICKYVCSTCGKSFKTQGSLYSHGRMHLPAELKNRHKCDVCNKWFSSAPNLSSHKKIHSGIKEYTCDQCGKNFTQRVNLDQHIKSQHTTEKPFLCNLCPKAFKTIYRLRSHQTLHSNVRPFKCETCGKSFREKGMMKAHTKIHSTEYPFECEFCKKCFKLKSFLKMHLRQHTGERPYSCERCDHHFTNWSNYSKHMRARHNVNVKSATTQFLQQQRLQLIKQEELKQNSGIKIDTENSKADCAISISNPS